MATNLNRIKKFAFTRVDSMPLSVTAYLKWARSDLKLPEPDGYICHRLTTPLDLFHEMAWQTEALRHLDLSVCNRYVRRYVPMPKCSDMRTPYGFQLEVNRHFRALCLGAQVEESKQGTAALAFRIYTAVQIEPHYTFAQLHDMDPERYASPRSYTPPTEVEVRAWLVHFK